MTELPVTQALTASQQKLVELAKSAREHAYAPYSRFLVGAAVLGPSGNVYAGCNVENASFGLSICAERVAIFKAVCAGEREIVGLALVTSGERASRPCGACRQVLSEFGKDATVVMSNLDGSDVVIRSSKELFPEPFELAG
jgi:cytidine deaminase